jgi:hypothetical protein
MEYIMAAITLTLNALHCVNTGLVVAMLPEQLDGLNKALASGRYEAGMHTGHIRLCQSVRESTNVTLMAKGHAKLKRFYWGKPQSDTPARRIAAHNEATLNQHGFTADPSTKTKGQLSKRQYGVYAAPEPKVNPEVIDFLSGMTIVPDVDLSTLEREPVKPPAIVMPKAPKATLPSLEETTGGVSGWATYRSRAMRAGMDKGSISAAWKAAKDSVAQPKVVKAAPVVKAQPKVVQPSVNAGNTIRVNADALAATLSALTDARIVSNEGAVFIVQYGA